MRKLTPEQRQAIARNGGQARFKGKTAEEISAEMKRVRAAAVLSAEERSLVLSERARKARETRRAKARSVE